METETDQQGQQQQAPDFQGLLRETQAERAKRQAAEARISELEAAEAERARKAAEEAGEYRRLYEADRARADELAKRVAAFEAAEKARLDAVAARNVERIKALPENLRGVVSALPDGTPPEVVSALLDRTEPLAASGAAGHAAQTRGGSPPGLTDEERAIARSYGMGEDATPEAVKRVVAAHNKLRGG